MNKISKVTSVLFLVMRSNFKYFLLSSMLLLLISFKVFAAPPISLYSPGETSNPSCIPEDTNCNVLIPLGPYDQTITVAASDSRNKESADYIADGVADEVEIQQAIDELDGHGIIRLLEGTFVFSGAIDIHEDDDGLHIQGAGKGVTILKGALLDGVPFIELHADAGETLSNVMLSHFSIDATDHAPSTVFIGMISNREEGNLEYLTIDNIDIKTTATLNSAISFYNDNGLNKHVRITNMDITNKVGNDIALRVYGIQVRKPTENLWIENNNISLYHGGSYNAIAVYAGSKYFHVNSNTVIGKGHTPIAISSGSYGEVTGNIVEGSLQFGSEGNEGGIEIEYKVGHGSTTTSHHIVVADNIVYNSLSGIYVEDRTNGALPPYDITIHGNMISNSTTGIELVYGNNITVYGNHYENNTTDFNKETTASLKQFVIDSTTLFNETTHFTETTHFSENVGIGTPSPTHKLTIENGNIQMDNNSKIYFKRSTNVNDPFIGYDSSNQFQIFNPMNTATLFYINSGEVARINSNGIRFNGNQSIYTTGSANNLSFVGNSGLFLKSSVGGGSGNISFTQGTTEVMTITPSQDIGIGTTSPTAKLSVNGDANKIGGGTWSVFSDKRSKEDIESYTMGLQELLQIYPVSFKYKKSMNWGSKRFVGLIAQEVEEIVPSMVSTIGEVQGIQDFKEVDPNELTYMLINSVKEQQAQIDALREQNNDLQIQIESLKY